MSAYETIQVILGFGMFTIALISLVVKLLKNDKKKYPSFNFGELNGYLLTYKRVTVLNGSIGNVLAHVLFIPLL